MLFPLAILLSCGSLIKRSNSSFISGSLIPRSSFSDSRCQLTHVCPSNLSSLRYLKKRYTHLGQSPNLGYGQRTLPRSIRRQRQMCIRDRDAPSFSWWITLIRSSFLAYSSAIFLDKSVEPSSTKTISKCRSPWYIKESMHVVKYFLLLGRPLYNHRYRLSANDY